MEKTKWLKNDSGKAATPRCGPTSRGPNLSTELSTKTVDKARGAARQIQDAVSRAPARLV